MIRIAAGVAEYPLYYDAVNEKGLGIAGLNFQKMLYTMSFKRGKKMSRLWIHPMDTRTMRYRGRGKKG